MKHVTTVTGPIPPNDLGQTLMHEHLFVDLSNWLAPPVTADEIATANQMVSINDIEELRREPLRSKDNLILNDLKTTIEEIIYSSRNSLLAVSMAKNQVHRRRYMPSNCVSRISADSKR